MLTFTRMNKTVRKIVFERDTYFCVLLNTNFIIITMCKYEIK